MFNSMVANVDFPAKLKDFIDIPTKRRAVVPLRTTLPNMIVGDFKHFDRRNGTLAVLHAVGLVAVGFEFESSTVLQ